MELLLKHSALLHAACRALKRRGPAIVAEPSGSPSGTEILLSYSLKENQGAPSPPSFEPENAGAARSSGAPRVSTLIDSSCNLFGGAPTFVDSG